MRTKVEALAQQQQQQQAQQQPEIEGEQQDSSETVQVGDATTFVIRTGCIAPDLSSK